MSNTVWKCCRKLLSYLYDTSCRQHFHTICDNIRQNFLSNAVEKCQMPSIDGEKYCQKMMSINRHHFQPTFFDKVLQNLTNFLSNYVEICLMLEKNLAEKCGRKMRSKNVVEKCCWIKLQQFFSTNFYSKFLGLFVK